MKSGKHRGPLIAATVVLLIAALLSARMGLIRMARLAGEKEPELQRFAETRQLMGTFVAITVFSPDRLTAQAAIDAAFERVKDLEKIFSSYIPDSDISKCNQSAAEGPVAVSKEAFFVIEESVKFSQMSNGAFDITVAPLIKLWRNASKEGKLPEQEDIAAIRQAVGYDNLALKDAERTVMFQRQGMALDLGGIAKGFIIDEAIRQLVNSGINCALVNAGGDIYAMGKRADGQDWTIGVQDPRRPNDDTSLLGILRVADMAVATSGNYQRFTVIEGGKYSHIIDPRTGMPADAIPSVTVIASDALTADALATALSVLPLDEGLALAEGLSRVEALLITMDDGRPVMHYTSGFPRIE